MEPNRVEIFPIAAWQFMQFSSIVPHELGCGQCMPVAFPRVAGRAVGLPPSSSLTANEQDGKSAGVRRRLSLTSGKWRPPQLRATPTRANNLKTFMCRIASFQATTRV